MERTPSRPVLPRAVTALTLVAALLAPGAAEAATRVTTPDDGRYCRLSADIHRWGPGDGPPARFIAERFARGSGEAWIGLGYTAAGFWSAESGPAGDACDFCEDLDLVLTRFDGSRRSFSVITSADVSRFAGAQREKLRDLALQRLWRLAARDWPAQDMKQDYAFRLPPTLKADGVADPFPGWMAEVSRPGAPSLRFVREGAQSMCWCHYVWRGFALAAPRRR